MPVPTQAPNAGIAEHKAFELTGVKELESQAVEASSWNDLLDCAFIWNLIHYETFSDTQLPREPMQLRQK